MSTHAADAGLAGGPAGGEAAGPAAGYGSKAYRSYVLNALLFIYILNFVDRGILSVVARPLKAELNVSDTAFGLLTGFGFAFLYTIVGIPLARMSETRNRVAIMAICLVVWSAFTALCGLSSEVTLGGVVIGGFWMLLLFRIGVGVGEAGCTPPANSLIADYYPPARRSTALGYYAMGVALGTTLANLVGGPVADAFGWRAAFFILGLPGVGVALLLIATVKEPPRGFTDPAGAMSKTRASWGETFRVLFSKPSFWTMAAGATLASFCGYAIANFQSLYLQRTFSLSAGQASLWINAPAYLAGAIGTMLTGWLAERIGHRSVSAIAWLPAAGLFICVPLYVWAFLTDNMIACLIGLAGGHFVKYGYLAAQYTIGQGVVPTYMRATATAILLFLINLLGYGFGPPAAGIISDAFFSADIQAAGFAGSLDRSMCDAAQEAVRKAGKAPVAETLASLARPVTPPQLAFCNVANANSTQQAMLAISAIYALAGLCFILCMFTLRKDMAPAK